MSQPSKRAEQHSGPPQTTENIRALLVKFAWMADEAEHPNTEDFFTTDASWHLGDQSWCGRGEISEFLTEMRTAGYAGPATGTRHIITNVDITLSPEEPDHAQARSLFMLCAPGATWAIQAVGCYDDELVRVDDHWRIHKRHVRQLPRTSNPASTS
ncbi:nuclear transport factor 2 family protein [Pseudoclavibacter terrae]|nr:nuclear transport factor 2 family protein [Pseudoclavibacter terrae]